MTNHHNRPERSAPEPRPAGAPLALEGIRIVDLSRLLAGPYGTMLLGDLGAEIIKIENPASGDDARRLSPPEIGGDGATFLWANRNKKSIAIDLRMKVGQDLVRDLVRNADVVVENFSAGVMDRFGLSYDTLKEVNPRIIFCAVSAFGRKGSFANRPGYDPVIQAESGFISLNGFPDCDPVRAGSSIVDISTGMMTCNAVLGALMARERHGFGQYVEVALFDDAIAMTGQYGMNYLITGDEQMRFGNGSMTAEPVGVFQTATGPIYLACANNKNFERLATAVFGQPDLASHPDYSTNANRMANKEELHKRLNEEFGKLDRTDVLAKAQASGVPLGLVRTISEAFSSDEIVEQKIVSTVRRPNGEMIPNIAAPFRFYGTPIADPIAPPLLGQHTDDILTDVLGLDADQKAKLAGTGVFGKTAENNV